MAEQSSQPESSAASQAEAQVPRAAARAPAGPPRLVDLIDLETLQAIQDGFAELTKAAASIRDERGRLVTRPSCSTRFCDLIGGALHDDEACELSNYAAAAAAAERPTEPVKYVCYAGLTQFAAAIRLDGRVLGTIVLGDLPEKPLTDAEVDRLAAERGLDREQLRAAAKELPLSREEDLRSAISFLRLLANTLTQICYQQAMLRERVDELTLLAQTSALLSSTLNEDEILDTIVRTMAEVMHVKACSLRLLNETGDELVIKATHGLSPEYLKKGPVLVSENPNDQAALRGEIIAIEDMQSDARVRYREDARREGLISSLAVGLVAKGRPLGTLHVYTGRRHDFTAEEVRLFRSVADQAALAVRNARLVAEVVRSHGQQRELTMAAQVQKRLLPAGPPVIPGYDCCAVTVPSLEVGGDFHDWIELPGGNWGIAVGDVAGKGVPAAILMAYVRAALRAQAEHVYELDHIMDRVNEALALDTQASEFATLFYGVLDSGKRRFTYCSAGHEPAILVRQGRIERLGAGGPLLGVMRGARYEFDAVTLQSGDTLVVYSDGTYDTLSDGAERFGAERLVQSVLRHASSSAARMVEGVRADIRSFAGLAPRTDDLTLLVVKVL